jgi:hypothetical protein
MVKKLVRRGGRWVEAYVDMGKGRARTAHGLPGRIINGQFVGPRKLGSAG